MVRRQIAPAIRLNQKDDAVIAISPEFLSRSQWFINPRNAQRASLFRAQQLPFVPVSGGKARSTRFLSSASGDPAVNGFDANKWSR